MPTSGLVRRLPSLTNFLGSLHTQQSSLTSPAWLILNRRNSLSKLLSPKEVAYEFQRHRLIGALLEILFTTAVNKDFAVRAS
jgi:hypothetical protein